nr:uncharacterized protein CI109_006161 [Kwoniella shandongensis]KAA5525470.1 hypothetical protein CI109_006161 [Kwoniella shandongensis]
MAAPAPLPLPNIVIPPILVNHALSAQFPLIQGGIVPVPASDDDALDVEQFVDTLKVYGNSTRPELIAAIHFREEVLLTRIAVGQLPIGPQLAHFQIVNARLTADIGRLEGEIGNKFVTIWTILKNKAFSKLGLAHELVPMDGAQPPYAARLTNFNALARSTEQQASNLLAFYNIPNQAGWATMMMNKIVSIITGGPLSSVIPH